MKFLLSKKRAIGDSILMLPTIQAIKENIPEAKISVLVSSSCADLFLEHPAVHQIWTFEAQSWWRTLRMIRREKFDYLFDLNSTGSSRKLFRFSGAKKKQHHIHNEQTASRYLKRPNAIEWDLWAVHELFPVEIAEPNSKSSRPKIQFTQKEINDANRFWLQKGVMPGKVVVLGLGASRSTKRWPAEYFARFAELARDRMDLPSAIIIGPEESERAFAQQVLNHLRIKGFKSQIDSFSGGGIIFHSNVPLRRYAALLATAHSYVGNDSGPKHIAAAVNTPTLSFFGPEDPLEWHPYSDTQDKLCFIPDLSCRKEDNGRWCGIAECKIERHRCMQDLIPEEVFEKFAEIQKLKDLEP